MWFPVAVPGSPPQAASRVKGHNVILARAAAKLGTTLVSGVSAICTFQKRFGTKDSVRCSEFRGGRFSEVATILQVWDFQSVTRTLSTLGNHGVRFSECPHREVLL